MKNFRLSEDDFSRVVNMIKIGERPLASAKLSIVDGLPMSTIAKQFGVSREAVRKSVARIYRYWNTFSGTETNAAKSAAIGILKSAMKNADIPSDWEPVVVYLPKNMANTIKNLELDKLQELKNKQLENVNS